MITYSTMCWGDKMGAQLGHLAALYYVCRENNQELTLFQELENFRAGFRFPDAFDIQFIHYLDRANWIKKRILKLYGNMTHRSTWKKQMKRSGNRGFHLLCDRIVLKWIRMSYRDFVSVGERNNDVHTDPALLKLGSEGNYDITKGYGTYQDWKKYEDEIIEGMRFKPSVVAEGEKVFNRFSSKKKVSVHIRKTDYLVVFPYHLDELYYQEAMSYFDQDDVQYLVFSDDIPACREMSLFKGKDVVFVEGNSGPVDMYLMSKCDNNIIANSTFSFWGAFLNRHENKKVVCPRTFVGETLQEFAYINGNYYPDSWIAI